MYESIQKRLSEELHEVKSSGRFKNEKNNFFKTKL